LNPERSASITEITNKGRRYCRLDLGNDEKGKRVTHDFHSRDSAETFKKICEEAWTKGLPTPIPDLGLPVRCQAVRGKAAQSTAAFAVNSRIEP
jgi:hypothetical protein